MSSHIFPTTHDWSQYESCQIHHCFGLYPFCPALTATRTETPCRVPLAGSLLLFNTPLLNKLKYRPGKKDHIWSHNPACRQSSYHVTTFPIVCKWKEPFILNHTFLWLLVNTAASGVCLCTRRQTPSLRYWPKVLIPLQRRLNMTFFSDIWVNYFGKFKYISKYCKLWKIRLP